MFSRFVHLILGLCISYPYLIKFHDFVDNSQEGMKRSNEGFNSGATGHDFMDNSNALGTTNEPALGASYGS
jgi:hypothetical protein